MFTACLSVLNRGRCSYLQASQRRQEEGSRWLFIFSVYFYKVCDDDITMAQHTAEKKDMFLLLSHIQMTWKRVWCFFWHDQNSEKSRGSLRIHVYICTTGNHLNKIQVHIIRLLYLLSLDDDSLEHFQMRWYDYSHSRLRRKLLRIVSNVPQNARGVPRTMTCEISSSCQRLYEMQNFARYFISALLDCWIQEVLQPPVRREPYVCCASASESQD